MFKKTLLVVALGAVSTAAMADGFYAGVGFGGEGYQDKVTSYVGTHRTEGALGVMGGLFGGYTVNFANQFNLGGEVFGNVNSAKITDGSITTVNSSAYGYTVKSRYNYGVRALPGYQVTPDTDVHALVGYVRGNFKFTDSNPAGTNSTNNFNGYQVGGGMGVNVMKNVAVRGDFYYTGYQTKTVEIQNKISSVTGVVSANYKFG